jgi:hypothetical protein
MSVPNESYSRNMHWVNTSSGGLLVSEGIIHPVVSSLRQHGWMMPSGTNSPPEEVLTQCTDYWVDDAIGD